VGDVFDYSGGRTAGEGRVAHTSYTFLVPRSKSCCSFFGTLPFGGGICLQNFMGGPLTRSLARKRRIAQKGGIFLVARRRPSKKYTKGDI